ncbi:hypothetical protein TNCT_115321 [Trichonephila clavata]|uniref:Uncharacterized protein n=1 Tax=Trichonephila clavata TaxID=2740835 RepID=A0A8X6G9E5_TRICU|nr:hypothetical protein TNCT_115321 [Trichonephila clavata]
MSWKEASITPNGTSARFHWRPFKWTFKGLSVLNSDIYSLQEKILTFHSFFIKRFPCTLRAREKEYSKINFQQSKGGTCVPVIKIKLYNDVLQA